ncbi:transposase domain-containing protein [Streptomyces vinaceus]
MAFAWADPDRAVRIDAVLAECGSVQERIRELPARAVVHVPLAAGLFEECGYPAVWLEPTGSSSWPPAP